MFGDFNVPKRWHPMGMGHRIIHDMRGIRAVPARKVHAAVSETLAEMSTLVPEFMLRVT
jgi:hypothetical protein